MAGRSEIYKRDVRGKILKINNFSGSIMENEQLCKHTTWKIGGVAKYLALASDENDVKRVVSYCIENTIPYCVIGNGSNILFSDDGFDGVVIKTAEGLKAKTVLSFGDESVITYFGAGNIVSELLNFSVRYGLSGLEFLAGIPATFGGILKMNAGAFNTEIKDIVEWINIYSPKEDFVTKRKNDLVFRYRMLELANDCIILGGALRLKKDSPELIQKRIAENQLKKKESQPINLFTCGSVFKNPPGDYAGRIIDEMGLKGLQVGGARISEKHANFIVNTGNATAKDVLTLIEMVKQKVWLKKQLLLEEEVVIINKNKGVKASVV